MRKITSLLLVLILFAAIFAGCSQSGGGSSTGSSTAEVSQVATPEPSAPAPATPAEDVTIRFMWWGNDPRHQATLQAIEEFNKLDNGITVMAEYGGWDGYSQKVVTQLAGNTAADVIQLSVSWLPEMHKSLLDLSTVSEAIGMDQFDKAFLEGQCSREGRIVGVPGGINGVTLMVNKTALEKFEIPLDTVWDWDKIIEYGKKMHEEDPEYYFIVGEPYDYADIFFRSYLYQKSGNPLIQEDYTLGVTKEDVQSYFEYLLTMLDNNVTRPFEQTVVFKSKIVESPEYVNGMFGARFSYTAYFPAPGSESGTVAEFAAAPFPIMPDAKSSGIRVFPSMLLSIPASSPNAEAAATFVNFLLNSNESAAILKTDRGIPASASAMKYLVDQGSLDPEADKSLNIALGQNPISADTVTSTQTIDISYELIQEVGFRRMSPEQAAEEFIRRMQLAIDEIKP